MDVRVVLVEPEHEGNIGSVARLAKNFGVEELWIVNPKTELGVESRVYAVHAKDTEILEEQLGYKGIFGQGWWRYRIPGWGMIDWKLIFCALNDVGYNDSIVIEHEDPVFGEERTDEGLKLGLKFLRNFMV